VSLRTMTCVWANSRASSGTLLVLLAIADFADDDGKAWPSVETLARKSRLSERAVRYALRELEKMGELATLKEAGPGGVNMYRVHVRGVGQGQLFQGANIAGGQSDGRVLPPEPSLTTNPLSTRTRGKAGRCSPEEAAAYFAERGLNGDSAEFVDHFEKVGWKTKAGPLADWKAAARNWSRQEKRWRGLGAEDRKSEVRKAVMVGRGPEDAAAEATAALVEQKWRELRKKHPTAPENVLRSMFNEWWRENRAAAK
jgi:hypothetical protein